MKNLFLTLAFSCSTVLLYSQQVERIQRDLIDSSALVFPFDIAKGPVTPDSQSFADNYQCPEWFRDAKFGIYMHWGVNSVPGYNGHYGRWMYWSEEPDSALLKNPTLGYRKEALDVYRHHVKVYGHPSKFGYKDFIPMWKAEKFNADSLAAFYKEVGAKFIGVMAVHHDNFDLYDSSYQPWNSVKMGPKLDVVGEWKKACEKVGVHFAISSHLSNGNHEHYFYQGPVADAKGPYASIPYDYTKPENEGLYGRRTANRMMRLQPEFAQSWYLRTKELIDKYEPELLYFDGSLPNGMYGRQLAAHFYNKNFAADGSQKGVLTIKRPVKGFTLDCECSGVDKIQKEPFLVDTTVNPGWFYMGSTQSVAKGADDAGMGAVSGGQTKDKLRMTAGQIVDNLVDIVSKNGCMMLNVGLRADGSLPETFRDELVKIGHWLKLNGEGIYGTRPYVVFGEGPSVQTTKVKYADYLYSYSAADFRFTTKGNALYVFMLDWPGNGQTIQVKNLSTEKLAKRIKSVEFLSTGKKLKWKQTEQSLQVTMPMEAVGEYAYAIKLVLKN